MQNQRLKIYFGGGATSQLIALGTAVYIEKIRERKFELIYVHEKMTHTQGCVIKNLTRHEELVTNYIDEIPNLAVQGGRFWSFVPLSARKYLITVRKGYESIFNAISLMKMTFSNRRGSSISLRYLGDIKSLGYINKSTKSLVGNYWPGIIHCVAEELKWRFENSDLPNIFEEVEKIPGTVSIHYRLGDMRTDPLWQVTHGVLDPKCILKIVESLNGNYKEKFVVKVFSDEPDIAKSIFQELGVYHWEFEEAGDIWADVQKMLRSEVFIGSYSSVSMLVAEIHSAVNSQVSFLPKNSRKHKVGRKQIGVNYFKAKFLPLDDLVYSKDESATN